MACRCAEISMLQRDLDRLSKASSKMGEAGSEDSQMNNSFDSGKGIVHSSFTSDTEGELLSSVDEVHNEVSEKVSGCCSEISEAFNRTQLKYDAYRIEDEIYHEEMARNEQ